MVSPGIKELFNEKDQSVKNLEKDHLLLDPEEQHTIPSLVEKINDILLTHLNTHDQENTETDTSSENYEVHPEETPKQPPLRQGSNVNKFLTSKVTLAHKKGKLEKDTYNLMMVTAPNSSNKWLLFLDKAWWFGIFTFVIQATLTVLVISNQVDVPDNSGPLSIPIKANQGAVTVAQALVIPLSLMTQTDVMTSLITIQQMMDPKIRNKTLPADGDGNSTTPLWRVLVPNILKLVQGLGILFASWVIIVQSNDVVDLLKDYTALFAISTIDDILFILAEVGHFGKALQNKTEFVESAKVKSTVSGKAVKLVMFMILALMFTGWGVLVLYGQNSGYIFRKAYPECKVHSAQFYFDDGRCQGYMNNYECGYDYRDCAAFNARYPDCNVDNPELIGNDYCDGGEYNTLECGNDGGDCGIEINAKYPDCLVENLYWLGDGTCDGGNYNTAECNYDDGDCDEINAKYPNCNVKYLHLIGDGRCHGGDYNTAECNYDGGDCDRFNAFFLGYCNVKYPYWLGDGFCDGGDYNTANCNFDEGDCEIEERPPFV